MRKSYILILVFFFTFHFLIPFFIETIWIGRNYIYDLDNPSSLSGLWINAVVIFLTICIVGKIKIRNERKIEPNCEYATVYFWISTILSLFIFFENGGFRGIIEGNSHGSFLSYLSLFFQPLPALFFVFFFQKGKVKYPFLYIVVFLISSTLKGSRSAILQIIFLFVFMPNFKNFDLYKHNLKKYLKIAVVVGPFLFIYATSVRVSLDAEVELILKMIEGRMSMIELSSIPLDSMISNSIDWTLFDEKYGIVNQMKMVLNMLSPYDFFTFDVSPNQYYRSLFLGYNIEYVKNVYFSLNLTLPVYWILETRGFISGILISVFLLLLYFKLMIRVRHHAFYYVIMLCSIYEVLYFFDIPMIVYRFFSYTLAFFTLFYLNYYLKSLKRFLFV